MGVNLVTIGGDLVGIASGVSGVAGAGKAILDFYKYFTELKGAEKARKSLVDVQKSLAKFPQEPDERDFLTYWLDNGDLLIPYVKQRLLTRFVIAMSVIVSAQASGAFIHGLTTHDTLVSLGLSTIQVLSGFSVKPYALIEPQEKIFLDSVMALRQMFYASYVLPTVERFNTGLEFLTDAPILNKELLRKPEWRAIRDKFQKAMQDPEEFEKKVQALLEAKKTKSEVKAPTKPELKGRTD